MYIRRILSLTGLLKFKSHFLLGPRQTGKSSLIEHSFHDEHPIIDLLRTDVYMRLEQAPWELENMIPAGTTCVIIEEVQRIPMLLNEVHRIIESKKIKFLLTGSSARKLKRANVNMLGGRAWQAQLFPLVSAEINNFDLNRYLLYGGLPIVYLSEQPERELDAYVNSYLKDEIQAEALVRKLPSFIRFLSVSSICSGGLLNFSKIASDIHVAPNTVREFYSILEDTLLGFMLPPFTQTNKRKIISTAKFYYFDLGVKNYLSKITSLAPKTDLYGQALEHFIALEIRAYLHYYNKKHDLCFWQTQEQQEVDFVIGNQLAIEVKSTDRVTDKHLKSLKLFREENLCKNFCIVAFDKSLHELNGIRVYYWLDFITKLWNHELI